MHLLLSIYPLASSRPRHGEDGDDPLEPRLTGFISPSLSPTAVAPARFSSSARPATEPSILRPRISTMTTNLVPVLVSKP